MARKYCVEREEISMMFWYWKPRGILWETSHKSMNYRSSKPGEAKPRKENETIKIKMVEKTLKKKIEVLEREKIHGKHSKGKTQN